MTPLGFALGGCLGTDLIVKLEPSSILAIAVASAHTFCYNSIF